MLLRTRRHPRSLLIFLSAHIDSPSPTARHLHSVDRKVKIEASSPHSTLPFKMPVALTIKKVEGKPGKVYYP